MNDPYDFYSNHLANEVEREARYGYINPNQFADFEDVDLTGKIDEELDIEEAEKVDRNS